MKLVTAEARRLFDKFVAVAGLALQRKEQVVRTDFPGIKSNTVDREVDAGAPARGLGYRLRSP